MRRAAFTLIELIFVILLIGVLGGVAVPKFLGMRDNAKITSELSTAASVQTAIDACHGEWIINEGSFTCGFDIDPSDPAQFDAATGYPIKLGSSGTAPSPHPRRSGVSFSFSGSTQDRAEKGSPLYLCQLSDNPESERQNERAYHRNRYRSEFALHHIPITSAMLHMGRNIPSASTSTKPAIAAIRIGSITEASYPAHRPARPPLPSALSCSRRVRSPRSRYEADAPPL